MSAQGLAFTDLSMHSQTPTWTAVDSYTMTHLHPATRPNATALLETLRHSRDSGLPDIASHPVIAKFYALHCRALRVRHALEVGALGGYTSIWLASENADLQVTTIEANEHHAKVARENVARAGLTDRIDVRLGAALDVLPKLAAEIAAGSLPKLGFTYIDADKSNNWRYMDSAIEMSEPGAVIFVDNIVQEGNLVDPTLVDNARVQGARKVIEMVGKDPRVDGLVLQTVGEKTYDGVLMVVVN